MTALTYWFCHIPGMKIAGGNKSNPQRVTSVLDVSLKEDIIQRMLNYTSTSSGTPVPPTDLQALAARLKVLAEPKRLLILHMLIEGVQCNCELGDALQMPPNLTSHHLRILREAGLVNVERDALDARWVYYSINQEALEELNAAFSVFFDLRRIKPRRLTCGPHGTFIRAADEVPTSEIAIPK